MHRTPGQCVAEGGRAEAKRVNPVVRGGYADINGLIGGEAPGKDENGLVAAPEFGNPHGARQLDIGAVEGGKGLHARVMALAGDQDRHSRPAAGVGRSQLQPEGPAPAAQLPQIDGGEPGFERTGGDDLHRGARKRGRQDLCHELGRGAWRGGRRRAGGSPGRVGEPIRGKGRGCRAERDQSREPCRQKTTHVCLPPRQVDVAPPELALDHGSRHFP